VTILTNAFHYKPHLIIQRQNNRDNDDPISELFDKKLMCVLRTITSVIRSGGKRIYGALNTVSRRL